MEPKHLAQANRHVRVSGKIIIDLKRIGCRTKPCQQEGQFTRCMPEHAIRDLRECIGEQHFFRQAINEPVDALGKYLLFVLARGQLHVHIMIAHNRSGNQLRKHGNVQRQ